MADAELHRSFAAKNAAQDDNELISGGQRADFGGRKKR
jgi:hypothetical protein